MKKLHFFGLLALVLALGVAFIACSSDSDSDDSVESSFTITGIIEGQDVEAIISKSSKAAYNIATGDYYIIRFVDGDVISRGTIEWEDPMVRFIPDDGSDPFYGYYTAGTLEINDVPYGTGTYKLGGQAPGAGTNNFPNLGPGSPWSNFTKSQSIVADAYDAAFNAAKDKGMTDAQAHAQAKADTADLVKEYEDLVVENMKTEQLKNWLAAAGLAGVPVFYPQDALEKWPKTVVYFVSTKVPGVGFAFDMPTTTAPEWTVDDSGTPASTINVAQTGTGATDLVLTYSAVPDPENAGDYLVNAQYLVEFLPVALFTVDWKDGKAGDKLVVDYKEWDGSDHQDVIPYGKKSVITNLLPWVKITHSGSSDVGFYISTADPFTATSIIHGTYHAAVVAPPAPAYVDASGTPFDSTLVAGNPYPATTGIDSDEYFVTVQKLP